MGTPRKFLSARRGGLKIVRADDQGLRRIYVALLPDALKYRFESIGDRLPRTIGSGRFK